MSLSLIRFYNTRRECRYYFTFEFPSYTFPTNQTRAWSLGLELMQIGHDKLNVKSVTSNRQVLSFNRGGSEEGFD